MTDKTVLILPTMPDTTPKFDSPPVIETAASLEFKPLDGWGIPHFGLFWERIRRDFPEFSIQPPLGSQIETFDKLRVHAGPQIELMSEPPVRCWFFDSREDRLIQVQHDRFVYNWRKGEGPYPSYEQVKPRFESSWETFCGFLRDEGIESPNIVQCELTYINHFEAGREWRSMGDLPRVLSPWSGKLSGEFLPTPEGVQVMASFLMPEGRGRLRIGIQPAIRLSDRKEIWQLTMVARGSTRSNELPSIRDWFDMAHEWIVRGFADLTSPEMHKLWQRRR